MGEAKQSKKYSTLTFIAVVFAIIGLACLVLGGILFTLSQKRVNQLISEFVVLRNGSRQYEAWNKSTMKPFQQFYVYDVTNPTEIRNGAKPILQKKGPYSYRVEISKRDQEWNENGTLKYFLEEKHVFDPLNSCTGCNDGLDTITTINLAVVTAVELPKHYDTQVQSTISTIDSFMEFAGKDLFNTLTVKELIWGHDKEKRFLNHLIKALSLEDGHIAIDPYLTFQKKVIHSVDTNDAFSSIFTGQSDIKKVNMYDLWQGKRELNWWRGTAANQMKGTDGTQFSPGISTSDVLYIFAPQLCRSFGLKYHSRNKIAGMTTYRFTTAPELYLSGDDEPSNAEYCSVSCPPTGLLDISVCQTTTAPVTVSPHNFLYSTDTIAAGVDGLSPPSEDNDVTFVDIEPVSGLPLHFTKRFQYNLLLEDTGSFSITKGLNKVYVPIYYREESSVMDEETATALRKTIIMPLFWCHFVSYSLFSFGALLIIMCCGIIIIQQVRNKKNTSESEEDKDQLIASDDSTKTDLKRIVS